MSEHELTGVVVKGMGRGAALLEDDRVLTRIEELGYAELPICIAKTQLSLTDNPSIAGRPSDFTVTVREARLSAGAGFAVLLTGEMMTMPGLPREPASLSVKLLPNGRIRGLMQEDEGS